MVRRGRRFESARTFAVAGFVTFCLPRWKVTGGGGFTTTNGGGLIPKPSDFDPTGVNGWGTTAVCWQVAAENFGGPVVAFVICAS